MAQLSHSGTIQASLDMQLLRLKTESLKDYATERARYERRQEQFRRRYRWRHQQDTVLQQRVTDWANAVSDC